MNINDIINIITQTTGVTSETAGTIIYTFILFFIAAFTHKKSLILTLLLIIPITLLFFQMNLLNKDLVVLLIFISALGIALTARQVIR